MFRMVPEGRAQREMRQGRGSSPFPFWFLLVLIPSILFGILAAHPELDLEWEVPWVHLILVGEIGLGSVLLSALITRVARKTGNTRIISMALAFYTMGIFLVAHAALTPGAILPSYTTGVEITLVLGFLLCSMFLASGSSRAFGQRLRPLLLRPVGMFVLLSFLAVATTSLTLLVPDFLAGQGGMSHEAGYGRTSDWFTVSTSLATIAFLGIAILSHYRDFRLTGLPFHHAMVTGLLLLQVAAVTFPLSLLWHLRWWEYHVLLLGGLGVILVSVLREAARRNDLQEVFATLLVGDTVSKLENSYSEALQVLIELVEAKDIYVRGHAARVARLSVAIGEALGLSSEDLRRLHQAALLHDVGKIAVPESILNKPRKLTREEFDIVASHTVVGEQLVSRFPALSSARPGVRWHHERLDGSGYPDGLKGEAIPLDARIIAVADVFDAMTSARAYRDALPAEVALAELSRNAGVKYDPEAVKALTLHLRDSPQAGGPQAQMPALPRERPSSQDAGHKGEEVAPIPTSLGAEERRQIKKRGILLAAGGLLLMLLAVLELKLMGITAITFPQWIFAVGLTVAVQALLWWILHVRWDEHIPWDPHYLYLPMGAAAVLLSVYTFLAPEVRFIFLMGWFPALLFMAGLAGFLEVLLLSGFMTGCYLSAILFAMLQGRPIPLAFEALVAAAFLLICAYAAIVFERLRRNRQEMKTLRRMLAEWAVTDPLTGLFNRRHFEEILQAELSRIQRYGGQCSLGLIDLDFFKNYNDTFGHLAGDAVLKDLAELMRRHIRTSDVLARLGGEEFGLIMVNTSKEDAFQAMERLRKAIEEYPIPGSGAQPSIRLTISVGIASYPEDAEDFEGLLRKADAALYAAKRQGRNRVEVASR